MSSLKKTAEKQTKNFIERLKDLLNGWETGGYSTPDGRGTEVLILVLQIKRTSEHQEIIKKCKKMLEKPKDDIIKEELSELLEILKGETNTT